MARRLRMLGAISICALLVAPIVKSQDHSDGASPYGSAFAPDVVQVDMPWNDEYDDYEGASYPDLADSLVGPISTDAAPDNSSYTVDPMARRAAQSFYLRVMPLGASITVGEQSTDGNGYRKWLRSQLRWEGWQVNMVGSKQDGSMADNDNEGHSGWIISQIQGAFVSSKGMMPNLVLVNAGTNDCIQNADPPNAGNRLKAMVDIIFNSIPGVTVIVSTIAKSRDHDACASNVSQQFRDMVAGYGNSRLGLADFNSAMSYTQLSPDGIHPTDDGYKLFAAVWWDAIRKVESLIQPPAAVLGLDDNQITGVKTCSKVAGNAVGPYQTQQGSGHDDGMYVHSATDRGILVDARIQKGGDKAIDDAIPSHMFFAQLTNPYNQDRSGALDDWIRILHNDSGINTYYFRENLGGGHFAASKTFDVDMDCNAGPSYAFADFNNDGLADFFCLKPNSAVAVSLNRGGNPPVFESIGQVVPTHDGFLAADVRIADIDGDGRADYCVINNNGDIGCSRNGGQGDSYNWQGFSTASGVRGIVFTGKNKGDKTGITFGDLNGDFRTDWMYIGDRGDVDTWINMRGYGKSIVPDWNHAGITHAGMGVPGIQGQIKFGRIFGSGRLDYIWIKEEDNYYDVHAFENHGGGGTRRKADGNFYCDMRGTGSDDYLWIYSDGHAGEIYANIHAPPGWGHDTKITLSVPGPRIGIHVADWTGDGKCDILVQNKADGTLTLFENRFNSATNTLTFADVGVVSGAAKCSQGWGVGIFDRGMRIHDVDGDGRADILCIELNGRITAWLNTASGLQNVGQIKFSEGWDRANIRFADVEHSGRADLIHLDKYTGAATVFKNLGHTPGGGGSSFSWVNRGVLYSPIDRGETMYFSNQGGLGRADLIHVLPVTNRAWTYFNRCGANSGGDDGPNVDPGLPPYDTGGGDGSGGNPGGGDGSGGSGPPPCSLPVDVGTISGQPVGSSSTISSIFFSLVNGTPYKMRLTGTHSYQMLSTGSDPHEGSHASLDWDDQWHDVSSGGSLYAAVVFDNDETITAEDDAGEAYYELDGTGHTFSIRAYVDDNYSPHWRLKVVFDNFTPNGVTGGQVQIAYPPDDVHVGNQAQLTLTGSEKFGYYINQNMPTAWMQSIRSVIGDRKLKYVCMPGSHDAGMSLLNGKTPIATVENTQTQFVNIYGQLVAGSRWFDVRPCLGNGGQHMLCHYSIILGLGQGANGQSVADAIDNINRFMSDYPGELVILDINDDSGFDTDNGYPRLTSDQWKPILQDFRGGIKNLCSGKNKDLANVKMNDFIGDGKGCVLPVIRIASLDINEDTMYDADLFPRFNEYVDNDDLVTMGQDQIQKLKDNRVLGKEGDPGTKDEFFVLSWTLTSVVFPILDMAADGFGSLAGWAFDQFTPFSYPNVLYVDSLGTPWEQSLDGSEADKEGRTTRDIVGLAMAVNLQIASENCYVGGGSIS